MLDELHSYVSDAIHLSAFPPVRAPIGMARCTPAWTEDASFGDVSGR
jgi:hypothetical protein